MWLTMFHLFLFWLLCMVHRAAKTVGCVVHGSQTQRSCKCICSRAVHSQMQSYSWILRWAFFKTITSQTPVPKVKSLVLRSCPYHSFRWRMKKVMQAWCGNVAVLRVDCVAIKQELTTRVFFLSLCVKRWGEKAVNFFYAKTKRKHM